MTLKKVKKGSNMYQGWVSHTHSHLSGKCSHECGYCYVQSMADKFSDMKERYSGKVGLVKEELSVGYGAGKSIFIEHMNDLFANDIPEEIIYKVLNHCLDYPDSDYIFQTKNPSRYKEFISSIPDGAICGTTIESNRTHEVMGYAPSPFSRTVGIEEIHRAGFDTFITIEPILKFDLDEFSDMIIWADPSFVNIGADSKGHGLDEPSYDEIMNLYERLIESGIEVKKKLNLDRIKDS